MNAKKFYTILIDEGSKNRFSIIVDKNPVKPKDDNDHEQRPVIMYFGNVGETLYSFEKRLYGKAV